MERINNNGSGNNKEDTNNIKNKIFSIFHGPTAQVNEKKINTEYNYTANDIKVAAKELSHTTFDDLKKRITI